MLEPQTTVARAVLDHSECAAVFQRHRIDYCCNGSRSIAAAAAARGLDTGALLSELRRAVAERQGTADVDVLAMATPSLVAHIVSRYHDDLRRALPFVSALAAKVSRVHGDHAPRLRDVDALVAELAAVLVPHLEEEEQVAFPALVARTPDPAAVRTALGAMHDDHVAVGALLARLRDAADDYRVPEWACTSYRTLFSELAQLETDVHYHVHLENHVLMPRFAAERDAAVAPESAS